jgi:hypothetical protein
MSMNTLSSSMDSVSHIGMQGPGRQTRFCQTFWQMYHSWVTDCEVLGPDVAKIDQWEPAKIKCFLFVLLPFLVTSRLQNFNGACKYVGIPFAIIVCPVCVRLIRAQKLKMKENIDFLFFAGGRENRYIIERLKRTHPNIESCPTKPFQYRHEDVFARISEHLPELPHVLMFHSCSI